VNAALGIQDDLPLHIAFPTNVGLFWVGERVDQISLASHGTPLERAVKKSVRKGYSSRPTRFNNYLAPHNIPGVSFIDGSGFSLLISVGSVSGFSVTLVKQPTFFGGCGHGTTEMRLKGVNWPGWAI
jgi:hypothetical protein